MDPVRNVSCFIDWHGKAQLEINDGTRVLRHTFDDPHILLNAAEKMRLVGTELLRNAPRPKP